MNDVKDEIDREPPEPLNSWLWGTDDVDVEIWSAGGGEYEVRVTCAVRRARWWQWWRSDLPVPWGKRKSIVDALKYSQSWLGSRKQCKFAPCYLELKVYFAKSD